MKISFIDIKSIYLRLHVKILSHHEEIEIVSGDYWCAAADEREKVKKKTILCLGSLSDDVFIFVMAVLTAPV